MVDDKPPVANHHPARIAAQEAGAPRYDTGAPCPAGHSSPRYTVNTKCVECARVEGRERYAAARPGKVIGEYKRRGEGVAFKVSARDKRKHLSAARELRKSFEIEDVRPLPNGASRALSGYTESAVGRRNSDYLNSLITAIHAPTKPEPEPEPVAPSRKIVKNGTSEGRYRLKPRSKVTW